MMAGEHRRQNRIGQRLRQLRQALQLSQQELGAQLAVSGCYLSMLENGLRQPSEHLLRLLCLTQNVNRHWLERGTGEMLSASPNEKRRLPRARLPYDRSLMKLAIGLVEQRLGELDRHFCVEEHGDIILNCYEKLLQEDLVKQRRATTVVKP